MRRKINKNKLIPVANRVLIKKDDKVGEIDGIVVSENDKKKSDQLSGVVIAVGNGRDGEKMVTKKGDVVLFGAYSGTSIGEIKEGLVVMEEHHILCIIDSENSKA
ncbi:co-chaperone GroES [bacterium]|nr:co-chaperone GroES [bacterium]